MDQSTLMAAGAGVMALVLLVQSAMLWRLRRALGGVYRLDEKLGHFGDALTLLTETTESGFQAVATELDRVTRPAAGAARATSPAHASQGGARSGMKKAMARSTDARIKAAVRRGRSVPEIASAEDVSEGEIRLRLHLAKQAAQAAEAKAPGRRTAAEARRTRVTQAAGARSARAAEEQHDGTVRA